MLTTPRLLSRRSDGPPRSTDVSTVEVPLAAAADRGLPAVSVRSGRRADGYAPAGRPEGAVWVPLTQSEFDRLLLMRRHRSSGRYGAAGFLVAGVGLGKFSVLLYLGVFISLVSGLMWLVATLGVMRLLPAVGVDREAGTVVLGRVHRRFAKAVADADM